MVCLPGELLEVVGRALMSFFHSSCTGHESPPPPPHPPFPPTSTPLLRSCSMFSTLPVAPLAIHSSGPSFHATHFLPSPVLSADHHTRLMSRPQHKTCLSTHLLICLQCTSPYKTCLLPDLHTRPVCPHISLQDLSVHTSPHKTCLSTHLLTRPVCPHISLQDLSVRTSPYKTCLSAHLLTRPVCPNILQDLSVSRSPHKTCLSQAFILVDISCSLEGHKFFLTFSMKTGEKKKAVNVDWASYDETAIWMLWLIV